MNAILTVTAPASNRRLAQPAALRTELGVDGAEASDVRLGELIDRAGGAIEDYLRRVLPKDTVSEQFRLERCETVLLLSRWPVAAISTVTEDGVALAASDYEADAASGRLWRLEDDAGSRWAAAKITVAYSGGYVLPGDAGTRTLPAAIESACLKLAAALWHAAARDPLVKAEAVDGVMRQDYWVGGVGLSGLPPDVCALLDPYRRVGLS